MQKSRMAEVRRIFQTTQGSPVNRLQPPRLPTRVGAAELSQTRIHTDLHSFLSFTCLIRVHQC